MLMSIGKGWLLEGHNITVLSAQPSYKSDAVKVKSKENIEKGFKILRMSLFFDMQKTKLFKLINMFIFPIKIFWHLIFNRRYSVVTISTAPPVLAGLAVALACKFTSTKFIYHCMDIHPEIGRVSGEFRNPFIYNILENLDNFTCKQASKVVVLSGDMKNSLLSRNGLSAENTNIGIINNFALPSNNFEHISDPLLYAKKLGKFRIIFAGNLGRFQGLERFIKAVQHAKLPESFELVFLGEGAARSELQACANSLNLTNVLFLPHLPINKAKVLIQNSDLGIVSLNESIISYAYPSKTMTYLEQSCPILVSVEDESELSHFVRKNNIGFTCKPNDIDAISNIYEMSVNNLDDMKIKSMNSKRIAKLFFSEDVAIAKWNELLEELV